MLLTVTEGLLDEIPVKEVPKTEKAIREAVTTKLPDICLLIESGENLTQEDTQAILNVVREAMDKESQEEAPAPQKARENKKQSGALVDHGNDRVIEAKN